VVPLRGMALEMELDVEAIAVLVEAIVKLGL
jgi:hypothetical protein